MAKYTIELRYLNNPLYGQVFDFDYNYYMKEFVDEERYRQKKKDFEEKFLQHYGYEEIGFETPELFKHYLKDYLDLNYKLWKERYETELRVVEDNIDFLLNKDLTEERTVEGEGQGNSSTVSNGNTSSSNKGNSKETINDTPSTKLNNDNWASQITKNENDNESNSSSNDNVETNTNSKTSQTEKLISRGNIGITSSAELLEKWRQIIIDIDKEIIEGAEKLFMQVL